MAAYSAFAEMQRNLISRGAPETLPVNFGGYGRGRRNSNRRRTMGYSRERQGNAADARARAEERSRAAWPSALDEWKGQQDPNSPAMVNFAQAEKARAKDRGEMMTASNKREEARRKPRMGGRGPFVMMR